MDVLAQLLRDDGDQLQRVLEQQSERAQRFDINAPTQKEDGKTLLHAAVYLKSHHCLRVILQQPNINTCVQDVQGITPLHIAVDNHDIEAVVLLMNANPQAAAIKNNQGKLPIDLTNSSEIEGIIRRIQIDVNGPRRTTLAGASEREDEDSDVEDNIPLYLAAWIPKEPIAARKHYSNTLISTAEGIHDIRNEFEKCYVERQEVETRLSHFFKSYQAGVDKSTLFQEEMNRLESKNHDLSRMIQELKERDQSADKADRKLAAKVTKRFEKKLKQASEEYETLTKRLADIEADNAKQYAINSDLMAQLKQVTMNQNSSPIVPAEVFEELFQAKAENIKLVHEVKTRETKLQGALENLKKAEEERSKFHSMLQVSSKNSVDLHSVNAVSSRSSSRVSSLVYGSESGTREKKYLAVSLPDLVSYILDTHQPDMYFLRIFLLNHQSFSSSKEVLQMFFSQHEITVKALITSPDHLMNEVAQAAQVSSILKYWCESFFEDFTGNSELIKLIKTFIMRYPSCTNSLESAVNRLRNGQSYQKVRISVADDACPKPILPKIVTGKVRSIPEMLFNQSVNVLKSMSRPPLTLMHMDALEIARQLCILEFQLYSSIKDREFIDLAWTKPDASTRAPGLLALIDWFNRIVHWLVYEIVSRKELKERIAVLEKIVSVGAHLDKLNNLLGTREIFSAINSSSVIRLQATFEGMSNRSRSIIADLNGLNSMESNHKRYRTRLQHVRPPAIPFPGICQNDLVFIEECDAKNYLDGDLINVPKFVKISEIIFAFTTFQRTPYALKSVPEIQSYIRDFPAVTTDLEFDMSLGCEPPRSALLFPPPA